MERPEGFDIVQRPKHYNSHPSGVECIEIVEYMGFNLGNAFKYLWRGGLKEIGALQDYEKALWYLQRAYEQQAPWPQISGSTFIEIMSSRKKIFNRPSPWCECVRQALAAICNACAFTEVRQSELAVRRAIQCVETAIADEQCMGRGLEP